MRHAQFYYSRSNKYQWSVNEKWTTVNYKVLVYCIIMNYDVSMENWRLEIYMGISMRIYWNEWNALSEWEEGTMNRVISIDMVKRMDRIKLHNYVNFAKLFIALVNFLWLDRWRSLVIESWPRAIKWRFTKFT